MLNRWGWSIYIEYNKYRILFDADTDPYIIKYNSRALDIDLSRLDLAFLSHRHGDHSGGFSYVARVRPGLRVYVPVDSGDVFNGLDLEAFVVGNSPYTITNGIWSTGSLSSYGLYEHGLILETKQRPIVQAIPRRNTYQKNTLKNTSQ